MTFGEQLTYLAGCERRHREFAAGARSADVRGFHRELIDHYARLAAELIDGQRRYPSDLW